VTVTAALLELLAAEVITEVWRVVAEAPTVLGAATVVEKVEWLEVDATATEEDADEAALSLSSSPEQRVTVMVASEGQACMP
jgi:hypothetical protein